MIANDDYIKWIIGALEYNDVGLQIGIASGQGSSCYRVKLPISDDKRFIDFEAINQKLYLEKIIKKHFIKKCLFYFISNSTQI